MTQGVGRALVLGGGPAGLYAALLLARRGVPVTLFERGPVPGGLAAGMTVSGMRVDLGSHRLHPSIDPGILSDLQGLMPGELAERRRHGRIRLAGTWMSFPLSPTALVRQVPARVTLRLAAGAARAALTPARATTFADVVRTGLGTPMGELFYFPYARKIWGLPAHELAGDQARRRISADTPWKLARKALARRSGRTFLYPDGGFGRIPEAIAAAASAAGADLLMGSAVERLERVGDRWRASTQQGHADGDVVLSTVPMTVLAGMLDPPPPVTEAMASLTWRAMILVYLTVDGDRWTPFDAHYFPGAEVPFTRISEPANYREGDRPERTVLCVEIPCWPGDELWDAPDAELVDQVRTGVIGSGLPDPGTTATVRRLPHAYPVYRMGWEAALETVDRWLGEIPGILTFGRQGLFAHDNTHHALAMARDAVASLSPDLRVDQQSWARARAGFEAHVVED